MNLDTDTLDFLEIVEAEPWEVLDVPDYQPITEADRQRSAGGFKLYFGKHKGKSLSEIPRDYLEWLVKPKRHRKSFNKARRMAAAYLKTEIR